MAHDRGASGVPSWLPDWRNAAAYPRGNVGPSRLAWEFLRRNSDYRADWARWSAFLEAAEARPGRELALLGPQLAARWGLRSELGDPASDRVPTWAHSGAYVHEPGPGHPALRPGGEDESGTTLVVFDLSRPLSPQLESARAVLRLRAAHWRARHPDRDRSKVRAARTDTAELVEMLRVLDAAATGLDPERRDAAKVIGGRLWPRIENTRASGYAASDRARQRWRAGVAYRDGRYVALAFMASYRVRMRPATK